jgi:3-oxo-5-alpha-steroid 4-dehydrogenase 1
MSLRITNACVWQATATFVALVTSQRAPYGRYFSEGHGYGFLVNGTLAWVLQECPTLLCAGWAVWSHLDSGASDNSALRSLPNAILLALFVVHYIHRTLIFPFRLVGGKPTPVAIMLMALAFCFWNGCAYGSVVWALVLQ